MDVLYSSPACDGHRQGLEWVGAGGMRWCFLHANVFGKLAAAQQRIQQLEAMTPFGEDFKTLAQQEAAEYTTIATKALKDAEEATGSKVVQKARQLLGAEPSPRNAALALEQIGAHDVGNQDQELGSGLAAGITVQAHLKARKAERIESRKINQHHHHRHRPPPSEPQPQPQQQHQQRQQQRHQQLPQPFRLSV